MATEVHRLEDPGLGDSARLVAPADADLAHPHEPARDGVELDLGGPSLRDRALRRGPCSDERHRPGREGGMTRPGWGWPAP